MATILDQDQNKDQQTNEQIVGQGGGGGLITGGASTQQGSSTPSAGGNSGGFTNLMSYVNANQGNDTQMGQQIQQKVGQDAQTADQKVQGFQQAGTKAAADGTVQQDTSTLNAVKNSPETVNKDIWSKQYNAQYGGPTDATKVDGYQDASQASQKVQQEGQYAAGSNADRQNLLSSVYERPGYSTGERNLDGFILGSGQGGSAALKNISQQYGNYGQGFQNAQTAVQGAIKQGQDTTAATKQAAHSTLQGAGDAYKTQFQGLQNSLGIQNTGNTAAYNTERDGLQKGDTAALQKIGVNDDAARFLQNEGFDPQGYANWLTQGGSQSLGDKVTADQTGKYSALQGLGYGGDGTAFDFSKSGNSGNPYTVDQSRVQAATQGSQLLSALRQAQSQRDTADMQARNQTTADLNSGKATDQELQSLGIDRGTYLEAVQAGIDPAAYLSAGQSNGLGDVANDAQRQQFSQIASLLGLHPTDDLAAKRQGGATTFDNTGFQAALQMARNLRNTNQPTPMSQALSFGPTV